MPNGICVSCPLHLVSFRVMVWVPKSQICVVPFRFTLVQKHTVEFNQVAMANSDGSEAMLNRVMTKDNIVVTVVLEVHKELFWAGMKSIHASDKQLLIVANAHMHWDPEYSDVKLIQSMMFASKVKNILEKASSRPGSPTSDPNPIPLVLCQILTHCQIEVLWNI